MNRWSARDERESYVDLKADRLAYLVLSFGLLAIVAYRSLVYGDAAWDLLGLVLVGGGVGAAYRVQKGTFTGRWAVLLGATLLIAAVVAALLVIARR
jgi:hypothetical protein